MERVELTKNFYLDEFTRSEIATRMGRTIEIKAPVHYNITDLCVEILQPLRDDLRRAIHITSGYRPIWLNKLVGGSGSSQHCRGAAADFTVTGRSPLYVCESIMALKLPIGQVIHEFGQWTHVSLRGDKEIPSTRRVLTASKNDAGRTIYTKGLREITA